VDDVKVLSIEGTGSRRHTSVDDQSPGLGHRDAQILMEGAREGDVDAFAKIVDAYWSGTLLYALHLVGERDPADDLTQEAFARLWQHRADWQGGSVRTWLLKTARHLFLSDQRKARVRAEWALKAEGKPGRALGTPLHEVERSELREAIDRAVRSLSPRRREAFTLVCLQELSNTETAEVMDVRPQTVANYLQAAFADLRSSLMPHVRPAEGSVRSTG
jgi:RNA polymerase sigma-70 factor (ECF subfamily)